MVVIADGICSHMSEQYPRQYLESLVRDHSPPCAHVEMGSEIL